MNILLVEPDVVLAKTYRQVLEQAEHQVQIANTAQSAIHAADDQKPDLIILEIQLVSHSGIEFLYELRSYSDWQAIPVVVVSLVPVGEFRNSETLLREELGVTAYYYKPQFTLAKLQQVVTEFSQSRV